MSEELDENFEDKTFLTLNGNKKSNEIILIFELNQTSSSVHDKLMRWLFKCLDAISYKVFFCDQYQWNIISQIKQNNAKSNKVNYDTNIIVVAIHITDAWKDTLIHEELIVSFDDTPSRMSAMLPREVADCLIQHPIFIDKIGISTVSSDVMMKWWKDMISTESEVFKINGKGYMVHPMWIKTPEEWKNVREQSYNFGWKGYNESWKIDRNCI